MDEEKKAKNQQAQQPDDQSPPDDYADGFPIVPVVIGRWLGQATYRLLWGSSYRPTRWESYVAAIILSALYVALLVAYFWMDLPEGNRKAVTILLLIQTPNMWKLTKLYWRHIRDRRRRR